MPKVPPRLSIADLQAEYAGNWVAVRNGEVVAASHSPYELVQSLRTHGRTGTIVRVPGVDELETVGIG